MELPLPSLMQLDYTDSSSARSTSKGSCCLAPASICSYWDSRRRRQCVQVSGSDAIISTNFTRVFLEISTRGLIFDFYPSLVPTPHPQKGGRGSGDIRALSWLCVVRKNSCHVTVTSAELPRATRASPRSVTRISREIGRTAAVG